MGRKTRMSTMRSDNDRKENGGLLSKIGKFTSLHLILVIVIL